MTSRDFCYWLQGFFEIDGANKPENTMNGLTNHQVNMIRRHLHMVFKHEIDPSMGPPEHQKVLNEVHDPPSYQSTSGLDGFKARC